MKKTISIGLTDHYVLIVNGEALLKDTYAECVETRAYLMQKRDAKAESYVILSEDEYNNKHGGSNEEATQTTDSKAPSRI